MKTLLLTAAGVCGAAAMIAAVGQERGADVRPPTSRLISALDADHDGTISAAEIRRRGFGRRGRGGAMTDGQLSADEIRSLPSRGPDGPNGGRR